MKVYLVTKSNKADSLFSEEPINLSFALAKKKIYEAEPNAIFYFYLEDFTERKLQNLVTELSSVKSLKWGIIDADSIVKDPALLFHQGACDFIASKIMNQKIDKNRIEEAIDFANKQKVSTERKKPSKKNSQVFPGWSKLNAGKEYEFIALFASIDNYDSCRKKVGINHFSYMQEAVQKIMLTLAAKGKGLLWIDDGQGYLLLFPPNDIETILILALEVLANIRLISFEQCNLTHEVLSLSFGLHKTKLPWQKPGKTESIVSDALNFIYHMGKHYTEQGCLDLTSSVFSELSAKTSHAFPDFGSFEETTVHRFLGFSYYKPSLLRPTKK